MISRYRAIVIGASAGGLSSIENVVGRLPIEFPVPVIVVHHQIQTSPSLLAEIFRERISLPVREINDKEAISSGVYTCPSNYHVLVNDDSTFCLSVDEPVCFSRPSIDVLFESASEVYGSSLIGVLLSGNNEDGSRGLKEIKRRGGVAIVEDPKSAEYPTMPQAALDATKTKNVLKVEEIAKFLRDLCGKGGIGAK